jgi:sRNA-binding regulator protein Hfq
VGKAVKVRLTDGELSGVITQAARFWIKLNVNGVVHYINKAYIVEIIPQAAG